ncbi:MAG: PVC-type heme-binding CxxCH protein [Chitinophagaceae bacterium]
MLHQAINEKELLKQVSKNNEKAFKILFDLYHGRIFNYVLRIIKSHQVVHLLKYFVFLLFIGCQHKQAPPFSKSAQEALSTFELEPGFKIELVASEPLLNDPVDMEIDENGKMYVAEMKGVPFDESGTGSVKVLTDTDGDGVLDKSTIFADSLILPSGVMRWKKGLLVTDPPHVYYFEDTNGDNKADIKRILLTGFDSTDLESNVNNPTFGLDNWIYVGNGGTQNKDIYYPDKPGGTRLPDNARGRMVRFRPQQYQLEMMSTRTQFGYSFDAWGNRFMVSNANHIYQEAIAAKYLKRNTHLLVANATQQISDHGSAADVFPITKNPENQLLTDIGVFTSASGITNYLGGAFPAAFNSNTSFTAEPAQNLVHVDHLDPKASLFSAARVGKHKEFLASTDPWFRPVNMHVGPDGALYVVDFYRQFIEGPAFMDEQVVKTGNMYNGTEKGRIYRISAAGAAPPAWIKSMDLGKVTDEQLVEKLADNNIWWRRNAQRMLLDRQAKNTVSSLVRMAHNTASPMARLHALWTLEGMNEMNNDLITVALKDPEPGIRQNAIRLAEIHLETSPGLVPALIKLKDDTAAATRFQLLCTLGFVDTPEANEARQELLFKDIADEWVQVAALSAPPSQNDGLLQAVLAKFQPTVPAYGSMVQRLSAMAAASQQTETVHQLLQKAITPIADTGVKWQAFILKGIALGLKSKKQVSPELQKERSSLVQTFFEHPSVAAREGTLQILQIIGIDKEQSLTVMPKAKTIAADNTLPADQRALAVGFLALQDAKPYASLLEKLITPTQPAPVQLAAIRMLSSIPDITVSKHVLSEWPSLTPELREAALNTFLVRPFNLPRVRLLLDAIEEGRIPQSSLGWSRSVVLMRDIPDSMKPRSRALLTKTNEKRKDVIEKYQAALQLTGHEAQGKALFEKNCSLCHQRGGADGNAFGPDLSTVKNWMPEKLVANILDPGISMPIGYDLWNVELKSGQVKQGIISSETAAAITLKNPGGAETTFAREDIQRLKALNMSAMPVGLEQQLSQQEMMDVVTFLRSK